MRVQSVALTCLLLFAPAAMAQDRYDVEVIVFEHADEGWVAEEQWRAAIVAPDFERAGLLDTAGAADGGLPGAFEALPKREGRLSDALRRLEQSGRYRVLRHLRWRQPAFEPGQSVPVRVRAGEAVPIRTPANILQQPVPSRGNRRAEQAPQDGTPGDNGEARAEASAGRASDAAATGAGGREDYAYLGPYGPRERTVAVHPLDGTIELVVSRYLHVHVDLYRTAAVAWRERVRGRAADEAAAGTGDGETPDGDDAKEAAGEPLFPRVARGPDDETMLSFPFRQSRRMRSGELHYIDHPRLGVLVLVTPHEAEDGGDAAESGGA